MSGQTGTTAVHRGPRRPTGEARRAALVCAFPEPRALPVPDSGLKVGRAWLADAGLADGEVSGAHVRFHRAGGALQVEDVGSRNGTWVNGTALAPKERVPLDEGALLRVGRTLFVVRRALMGAFEPASPLGELVGPFGLRALAKAIAALANDAPETILIVGETGTGKELTARALAAALGRAEPYGAVNVAGVAEGVFDAQLFGHVAGAYSGSKATGAAGVVRAHDGGTVFLDEIGELPTTLQAKLLRLLDNREVLPVGAERASAVDVLLLAATNRDLPAMVEEGLFRADLYARLARAVVRLPPLRERAEDIFAIACRLSRDLSADHVEVEAVEKLMRAAWPRNVRQLESVLSSARRADPDPGLRLWAVDEALAAEGLAVADDHAGGLTEANVRATLEECGDNVSAAAKRLGVSRGKLLRFLKRGG